LNITVKIKFPEPINISLTVISAVIAAEEIILVGKWTQNSFLGLWAVSVVSSSMQRLRRWRRSVALSFRGTGSTHTGIQTQDKCLGIMAVVPVISSKQITLVLVTFLYRVYFQSYRIQTSPGHEPRTAFSGLWPVLL
jgi:hypothetical protein